MNKSRSPQRTDPELTQAVAKRLREVRAAGGHSQEYVQENTGVNISRIETGAVNISLVSVSILCRFYRISLTELFRGIDLKPWE